MSSQFKARGAEPNAEALFFLALDDATTVCMKFARYFAAGIVGLIALFTIVHWTQTIFTLYVSKSNPIVRAASFVSTPIRRQLKGWAIGTYLILPGRVVIALTYFGINIACMFPQLTFEYDGTFVAKRCGW